MCVCVCVCVSVRACVCIIHNGRGFFGFNIRTNICMVWAGYEMVGGGGGDAQDFQSLRDAPSPVPPCMTQTPATRATTPCVRHESIYGWEWAMIPQSLTGSLQTNIQKMASKVANTIISFIRQNMWFNTLLYNFKWLREKKSFGKKCETNQWSPVSGKCKKSYLPQIFKKWWTFKHPN